MRIRYSALALFLAAGAPAFAEDEFYTYQTLDSNYYVGTGVARLQANELVWSGNHRLSQLIWQSTAPVLRAGFGVNFNNGWTVKANGTAALGGDSHMEDYDWIPYGPSNSIAPGSDWDQWTHRSVHPDTRLDYYVDIDAAVGYDVFHTPEFTANINVGLKYTDVKWTASGGTGLYSGTAFRDTPMTFPDSPGIDYNQKWPILFAGLDTEYRSGAFSLGLDARAGVTFKATAPDNHYLRNLRFVDNLQPAPVLSLRARAAYAISDTAELFVAGQYDRIYQVRGDTDYYTISGGTYLGSLTNVAGADFQAVTLTGGFKGTF